MRPLAKLSKVMEARVQSSAMTSQNWGVDVEMGKVWRFFKEGPNFNHARSSRDVLLEVIHRIGVGRLSKEGAHIRVHTVPGSASKSAFHGRWVWVGLGRASERREEPAARGSRGGQLENEKSCQ